MADLADEVWIEGRDSACAEPLRLAAAAAGFEPKICFESAQWLGKQGLVAAGVGDHADPDARARDGARGHRAALARRRRAAAHDLDRHARLRLRGAGGRADARGAAPGRGGALLLLRRLRELSLESPAWRLRRGPRSRRGRSATPRRRSGRPRSRRSPASRSSRCTPRPDLPAPEAIGLPGEFPFTRGVYPSMYRGRLWTMRQFAGFGTAEETNERFRYLLDHGQTGLSTAFDMPSLMGYDSDHMRSLGEVGREGVAIDSLDDMETLFAGIDLGAGHGLDDDQRAGGDHARLLRRRGGGERRAARPPRRHDPGRHPQGVHRPEGVVLPGRPGDAAARRHDRVVGARAAALAPGLDLRLPHPRGRLDGGAGARVHAQGRPDLRRAGGRRAGWTSTTSRRG